MKRESALICPCLVGLALTTPSARACRPPGLDMPRTPAITSQPAFSPDGRLLALIVANPQGSDGPPGALRLVDTTTWTDAPMNPPPTPVVGRSEFSWAPGKRTLAVALATSPTSLWLYKVDDGRWTRLTRQGRIAEASARWSHDGRHIAWYDHRNDHVVVQKTEGSASSVLTEFLAESSDGGFDWSTSGDVVWAARTLSRPRRYRGTDGHVHEVVSGVYAFPFPRKLGERPKLLAELADVRRIRVSPDGRYLACGAGRPGWGIRIPEDRKVLLIDCGTSRVIEVPGASPFAPMSWSHDGNKLCHRRHDGAAIYDVNRDTSHVPKDGDESFDILFHHPTTHGHWAVKGFTILEQVGDDWLDRFKAR